MCPVIQAVFQLLINSRQKAGRAVITKFELT